MINEWLKKYFLQKRQGLAYFIDMNDKYIQNTSIVNIAIIRFWTEMYKIQLFKVTNFIS